jgi:CRP-like cAMP-binding protein
VTPPTDPESELENMDLFHIIVGASAGAGEYIFECDDCHVIVKACEKMNPGQDDEDGVTDGDDDEDGDGEEIMMTVINGLSMFDRFDEEAKEELCSQMVIQDFAAASVIFKQDEQGDHLYIILEGTAKVLVNAGEYTTEPIEVAKRSKGACYAVAV